MSCIIPSSYPTLLPHLYRSTILPLVSRQISLRFYSFKKMSNPAIRFDPVGADSIRPVFVGSIQILPRPVFVGSFQIFPRCQAMSNYAFEQDSSSISKNGSSHTETIEQERYSARAAGVKSEQFESRSIPNHSKEEELFPDNVGSGYRNRHFNKRRARIDVTSEKRAGEVENVKSQQDESSLPTRFWKKRMPNYIEKSHYDQRYSKYATGTGTKKFDNSEGLLKIEPFDICLPVSRNSGMLKACSNVKDGENQNEIEHSMEGTRQRILRPGMVLLKRYLSISEQINIVKTCQELGLGPTGFYQPRYQDGAKLRLQMMCLGLNWNHQTRKYEDRRSVDGLQPPSIPNEFSVLVQRAIQDAHALIKRELKVSNVGDILPAISPDICIVNFYTTSGRLGLHQDRDERPQSIHKGLPVVSFSLGDSAEFLYGDHRDVDKAEKIVLESGDVLIFGGKSRRVFHGVTSIIPNSAPEALLEEASLRPGRLNLTFRQY